MPFLPAFFLMAALPVMERSPAATDLFAYPEDGKAAAVNPPGFCWTPMEKAKRYRIEVRTAAGKPVLTAEATSTVYPPSQTLAPGEYVWNVAYLDSAGSPFGTSRARRFLMAPGTPALPMPDVARLKASLAGVRPRMFLAGGRLRQIREAVARGAVPSWGRLRAAADAALAEPSYPDPEPYRKGHDSDEEWNRTFTPGKVASAHLARTALAWRVTGDPKYLAGAKRWFLAMAAWNPRGITSHRIRQSDGTQGNDEASMPMLERMSFAWDWMGGRFTPAERARILACVTERGNQVLDWLLKEDFLSHPYNNHEGRALAFLGEAGLSFLGDIPDADKWLDYVLRCYLTSYPGWGGDEGGWAQGISYWSIYVYWLTDFAEALREVTNVDILRRPFFRNTGYLPVYFHPPLAPRGAFGDGGYHAPSEVEGLLIDFLADAYRDPVLKWQARSVLATAQKNATKWREWYIEDVVATWRSAQPSPVEPAAPVKLDGSRFFSDIGWAAMHSALGDPKNDVYAMFKSSRFGSYSHSHADQNTFQLNAWGCALAIDSGYYPSYGTPHDNLWTRQTRAHNGILVNGRGQPPFTWEANGTIDRYERRGIVTIARGQAAQAYNLPQPASLAREWLQVLKDPLPAMKPDVESFARTVAFVASKTRPVLVVHDALRTSAPTGFDWLLHAVNRMKTDGESGAITIEEGGARLAVRLLATVPFRFSQTSAFPVQPEAATNTAYVTEGEKFTDQWHLRAMTQKPVANVRFVAVLAPYRASEPEPAIRVTRSGDRFTVQVGPALIEAGETLEVTAR